MKVCESCGDEIPRGETFESDDEEIFEKVMVLTSERDICLECALTSAVIEQTQSEEYQKKLRWY
jgi:hypothetical protein